MSAKVYINGKFFEKDEARVSVFDHGLLYGDGVFEGIRVYSKKCFHLDEHIQRLYESAMAIALNIPMTPADLTADVNKTVKNNGITDGYVRLVVTRGAGALGLDPDKTANPQIIIIADTIQLYPESFYRDGMAIITASTIRNHLGAMSPKVKSLNYLNNIMAKIEAKQAGCLEALMLNHNGEVAECTGDNVFVVKNGCLLTPPESAGILVGITRNIVMDLARAAKISVAEVSMTRFDVYTADECFLTGTAAEMIPVVKVDGRSIGNGKPGPLYKKLHAGFQKLTI